MISKEGKRDYYNVLEGVTVLDIIHYSGLNFSLGNVIKYVLRAGKKHEDPLEDLIKARTYLDYEIKKRQTEKTA